MHNTLFESALGIASPWYVQGVDFDEKARTLTIRIDFVAGSRFAHLQAALGTSGPRHAGQAAATPELLPARVLPGGACAAGETARWARAVVRCQDILMILCQPPRATPLLRQTVLRLLLHEAPDPHRNRPSLIAAVEMRRHAYR